MAQQKETLCWSCKRPGTRTCSWDDSKGNVPVEGWTAEERPYPGAYVGPKRSFHVIECPLYEKDEKYYIATGGEKPVIPIGKFIFLVKSGLSDGAIENRFGVSSASVRKTREKLFGGNE